MARRKLISLLMLLAASPFCTFLAIWASHTAIGQWIELRTYDLRFKLRGPLSQSRVAPVTLVGIDEEAFRAVPEPTMLWHAAFARAIDYLVAQDVSAIGIDFIFADIKKFDPEGQRMLSASLIQAGAAGVPIVLTYRILQGGIEQPTEAVRFAALASGHELAFANLTTDSDDFVRRQQVFAEGDGKEVRRGFALALAEAFARRNRIQLRPPTDPTILINYRGTRHFQRISFGRIVQAAEKKSAWLPGEDLKGRIVLIGRIGLAGDEDLHSTPQYLSPRAVAGESIRTPGVEIHANVVTTLLENGAIRHLSDSNGIWVTLGLVIIALLLCLLLSPYLAIPLSVVVILVFLAGASLPAFRFGWWIELLPPFLGAFMAMGMAEAFNYLVEGREKRHLRTVFKRYVNDQVIERILQSSQGVSLTGERKPVTVLFADIRGFTSRSEKFPAEVVVSDLNDYFTAMVAAVQSRGGMVDKFIGDGIMAIFGAPVDDPDSAIHGVQAAQDMVRALKDVNRCVTARGSPPIHIGIGLHSGEALVGNIGSPMKMEYTAIGDVVNVASRIEGLNKKHGTQILISGEVMQAAGREFKAEFLGKALLKGRGQPIDIYKIETG